MVNTILNKRPDSSSENSGYKINAENKKTTPKQDNLYFWRAKFKDVTSHARNNYII